jgi:hypothetical protein
MPLDRFKLVWVQNHPDLSVTTGAAMNIQPNNQRPTGPIRDRPPVGELRETGKSRAIGRHFLGAVEVKRLVVPESTHTDVAHRRPPLV